MRTRESRATRHLAGSLLLLAAGASVGLLLGVWMADPVGGVSGLRRRFGSRTVRRHREDRWRGDERHRQPVEILADDYSELAPEAITHLHVHDRFPRRARRGDDGGRGRRR